MLGPELEPRSMTSSAEETLGDRQASESRHRESRRRWSVMVNSIDWKPSPFGKAGQLIVDQPKLADRPNSAKSNVELAL